jgi:hypothetical protein
LATNAPAEYPGRLAPSIAAQEKAPARGEGQLRKEVRVETHDTVSRAGTCRRQGSNLN